MRSKCLLVFFTLLAPHVFSQTLRTFRVESEDGLKFTMYVDGFKSSRSPTSGISFNSSREQVNVRIVFSDRSIRPIYQRLDHFDDKDCRYIVRRKGDQYFLDRQPGLRDNRENQRDDERPGKSDFIENGTMCSRPTLSDVAFVTLKKKISDTYLNFKKAEVAKAALENYCVTAEQSSSIVRMLNDYTSEQFEVAKTAYMHMYDTRNFEQVIQAVKNGDDQKKLREFALSSGNSRPSPNPSPGPRPQPDQQDPPNRPGHPPNGNPGPIPPHLRHPNCRTVIMSDREFESALQSIRSVTFDDSKLEQAKLIVKNNCFSVTQVREMIRLITFEDMKLNLAKFAYDRTHDKHLYYEINQEFTFDNSRSEMTKFLNEKTN